MGTSTTWLYSGWYHAIVFADNLVLLALTEADLQYSIYDFYVLTSKSDVYISTEKSTVTAFVKKKLFQVKYA
jgi:hypothetical protein